jgi:hypothetical protein
MIKFLIISVLIFYVVFRLGGFLLRFFLLPLFKASGETAQGRQTKKKGDINIDFIPEDRASKKNSQNGEYIDYEEIK